MKTHGITEYSRLINPAYSKYMRRFSERIGFVLFSELVMFAVAVVIFKSGFGGGGYWGAMAVIIFSAVLNSGLLNTYGMFRSDSRNNLFFRTIPGKRSIMKKALINSEINRFLCVAVFSAGAEVSMMADGKEFKLYNALAQMMVLNIVVSLFVYFFRTGKRAGVIAALAAGTLSLIVQLILINAAVTLAAASAITVLSIAVSIYLDYILLEKLTGSGRKMKR